MLAYSLLIATAVALQTSNVENQGWSKYSSDEGKIAVDMLGQPEVEKENITTPVGKVPMTSISSTSHDNAYTVIYFDYPDAIAGRDPDTVLNNIRDAAVSRGKLSSERTVTLDGYPGRDIEYEWPDDGASGGPTYYRERLYLVGKRLYRSIYVSRKADTSTPQVDRWLNSFTLVFGNGQKPPVSKNWRPASASRLVGGMVDAAIPLLGGIYATLLGFRKIGKRPGESINCDLWHQRWDKTFRFFGPILVMFGVYLGTKSIVGQ
ncbi:MAG: hypothetical protein QOD62_2783 [Actinomycetota bacterium]|nr:hypothetical protein [Actinomycetota bacterium]